MASTQRIEKGFKQMLDCQDRLIDWSSKPEVLAKRFTKVSEWWVALHVEHLGKTADVIFDYLERFVEVGGERGKGGPTVIGRMVLLSKWIPRGSAPVPDFLSPDDIDAQQLHDRLTRSRSRLLELQPHISKLASTGGTQPHPLLGHFTVTQWIDFLIIHDHHHFKIVRDIEKGLA